MTRATISRHRMFRRTHHHLTPQPQTHLRIHVTRVHQAVIRVVDAAVVAINKGDYIMNKQKLIEALRSGSVTVKFTKVNGTVRTMNATLKSELLPEKVDEAVSTTRAKNEEVLNVWSVDDAGWRSFRWDALIEWEPND